jgi:hypothetical protein
MPDLDAVMDAIMELLMLIDEGDDAAQAREILGRFAENVRLLMVRYATIADVADHPKGSTPLHFAARRNRAAICRSLVELGALVDAQDSNGATPLMVAAERDCIDSFRALVDPVHHHPPLRSTTRQINQESGSSITCAVM